MLIPKRSSPFSELNVQQEARRRAAMYQSRRMYEELDQWWTVGTDDGFDFNTGWSARSGAGPPQMRMDPTGMVHVRGVLEKNSGGGGDAILFPATWGPVPVGAYIRVPCFLEVLTGTSPGATTSFYVLVENDVISSPGTAGYSGTIGTVTSYRIDLGHLSWRREL